MELTDMNGVLLEFENEFRRVCGAACLCRVSCRMRARVCLLLCLTFSCGRAVTQRDSNVRSRQDYLFQRGQLVCRYWIGGTCKKGCVSTRWVCGGIWARVSPS